MRAALPGATAIGAGADTRTSVARERFVVARERSKRSVSWIDTLTLAAIGLVVVLVSLPRLRRFALSENETDALRMLRVLSTALSDIRAGTRAGASQVAHPELADLVSARADARRVLADFEALADGRVRRHGYLFDLEFDRHGEPVLCAWPWDQGRTGQGAFAYTRRTGLVGHTNEGGIWTGPSRPLTAAALEAPADWRVMARF